MRIAIVGAGAIGQVYGHHLARGGARVAVFVRPSRRAEALAGYQLTHVPPWGPRRPERFVPDEVFTDTERLAAGGYDQVWLTIPTNALDRELLLAVAAPRSTIVVLSPGHFVRPLVRSSIGEARVVYGAIGAISYPRPLPGSVDEREQRTAPGLAFLLSRTRLSSSNERRALDCVTALRAGGCPADITADAPSDVALETAMLMPAVAALEIADWSFAQFSRRASTSLCTRAMVEALAITSLLIGRPRPFYAPLLSSLALGLAARAAPRFVPLDLEGFFRVHFTKVGDQSRLLIRRMIEDGEAAQCPTFALRELMAELNRSAARRP